MDYRIVVIGAHPDDPDIRAGGSACAWAAAGHNVRFISMTDGRAGHHELYGSELVHRRRDEAAAAAAVAGIEYRVLDNPDGCLRPSVENRKTLIRLIREYDPDLVLTHRTNDYHPDHRYTAQLVRDAAYMVIVPDVCPETPPLESNPVFGSLFDTFERPVSFEPDLLVPIEKEMIERKYEMLDCHESQLYEWLPYTEGNVETVPEGALKRHEWLKRDPLSGIAEMRNAADRFRDRLVDAYGAKRGREIEYVEPFEISEYGSDLAPELEARLVSD